MFSIISHAPLHPSLEEHFTHAVETTCWWHFCVYGRFDGLLFSYGTTGAIHTLPDT